jgi:hypothetical protein
VIRLGAARAVGGLWQWPRPQRESSEEQMPRDLMRDRGLRFELACRVSLAAGRVCDIVHIHKKNVRIADGLGRHGVAAAALRREFCKDFTIF